MSSIKYWALSYYLLKGLSLWAIKSSNTLWLVHTRAMAKFFIPQYGDLLWKTNSRVHISQKPPIQFYNNWSKSFSNLSFDKPGTEAEIFLSGYSRILFQEETSIFSGKLNMLEISSFLSNLLLGEFDIVESILTCFPLHFLLLRKPLSYFVHSHFLQLWQEQDFKFPFGFNPTPFPHDFTQSVKDLVLNFHEDNVLQGSKFSLGQQQKELFFILGENHSNTWFDFFPVGNSWLF